MAEAQAPAVQPTSGRDVFISYATHDKAVAESVCRGLENAGLPCWIAPRDVTPGESFAGAIVHAIDATKVIVLVLSEHAADSQHVLREVERAASKRHAIIAFRLDMKPLPADFEYFLNTSQWLDASSTGVKQALPRLVDAVKGTTAHAPPEPGSAPLRTVAAPAERRWRPALVGAMALILGIPAYVLINHLFISKPVARQPAADPANHVVSDKSIAVLPFSDMSEKHDQEYFSDGLTEELIDHLAHAPELKVIARTSSFAFKGKNEDMRTIATKLGVANLLEGSVRKAGNELRVTAQLIRAADGIHLWSQTYDRTMEDIFKLQDEIATTVSKALEVALNPSVIAKSDAIISMDAYNLFLKGNYYFVRGNTGDSAKAVAQYLQAVRIQRNYALAWAMLARTYMYQANGGEVSPQEAADKARRAAQQALEIDPRCAVAHYALGNIHWWYDYDWAAAKDEFGTAYTLDPHGEIGPEARINVGEVEAGQSGNSTQVIRLYQERVRVNPLDTLELWGLIWHQQYSGQLSEAAATSQRLLDLNPGYTTAQAQYAQTLLLMGHGGEALTVAERETNEPSRLFMLACTHWTLGHKSESTAALESLAKTHALTSAYLIAEAYAWRHDADSAFRWMEQAYLQHDSLIPFVKLDPMLRNLHGDPRFDAFLRKMGLLRAGEKTPVTAQGT